MSQEKNVNENKQPKSEKDTQSRKWQLTINNPQEKGFDHQKIISIMEQNFKSVVYWCMSDEIGENKTYHTHIFICGRSGIRFSTLKNKFPGAHFEMCNGTAQENKDYVQKSGKWEKDKKKETSVEGTFYESGEIPVERKRKDNNMEDVYSMIKDGLSNEQIIDQIPDVMFHLNDLDNVRQAIIYQDYKNRFRDLSVVYIYGDSRTGKTRSIMDGFGYDKVFRVSDYQHAFDNYRGQDILLLDEFRSSINLSFMLKLLEGYPLELPCRYFNKWACFTQVFIVSNVPLAEQYKLSPPEDLDAFYHRINCVRKFTQNGIQQYSIQFIANGFRLVTDGEMIPFLGGGRYVS